MRAAHHRPALLMLALEPRWVFDGAVAAAADHPTEAAAAVKAAIADTPPATQVRAADPAQDGGKKEVAFVDSSVTNWQALIAGIRPGVEIELIDGGQNGLAQMALWAETHSGYDAIHVLSHGDEASVQLGSETLSTAGLADSTTRAELAEIGAALKAGGDLMLYGCDVAKGADGQGFIADLAAATGATVAASTDLTGATALGGDWTLEAATGSIEVSALGPLSYDGLLDLPGATTATDAAGDLFLQGNYICLGISPDGNFGTVGVTPGTIASGNGASHVGLVYNYQGFGVGPSTNNIDFFVPGTPYEGFDVAYNDGTEHSAQNYALGGSSGITNVSLTNTSSGNTLSAEYIGIYDNTVKVTIDYQFSVNDLYFKTTVKVENISASGLTNVGYGRGVDPDNTAFVDGHYDTVNTIVSQSPAQVTASSPTNYGSSPATIMYYSTESSAKVTDGMGFGAFDPLTVAASATGTVSGDSAMAISFSTGALAAGASKTFVYYTALTNDITATITAIQNDSGGASNAAPTLTTTASVGYTERGSAATLDSGIVVADSDNTTLHGATVSISSGFLSGDTLTFVNQNGISGSYDATTGVLTLSGTRSLADYQTALRSVTFSSTSHDPTAGNDTSRTISWVVDDGMSSNHASTALTSTVTVTPVNDAPTLTATGTSGSLDHVSTPVSLFSGTAIDTVETGQSITQVTLSVSGVHDGANECLRIDGTLVTLTDGTSGTTTANGVGYLVVLSGTTATVTLSKSDTPAHWQSLINALAYDYENAAATSTGGDRVVTLTRVTDNGGTDNGGVASTPLSVAATVQVTANDTPTLTAGSALSYMMDTASHAITGITVTDSVHAAQISVGVSAQSGTLSVSASSLVSGNGSRSLTLTGTVAEVNALLATLGYTATSAGSDVVTVRVDDGGSTYLGGAKSASETVAVTVRPQPTIPLTTTVPTPQPVAPVVEVSVPIPSAPTLTLTQPSSSGGGTSSSDTLAALSQTLSAGLGGSGETSAPSSTSSPISSPSSSGGEAVATTPRDTSFAAGGTSTGFAAAETGSGTTPTTSVPPAALAATLQGLSDGTVQSGGGAYDAAMTNALAQGRTAAEAVALAQQAAAQANALANADSGRSDAGAVLNTTLASLSGSGDGTAGGSAAGAYAAALANALAQGRPVTEATQMARQAAAALAGDSGTPESAIASGADADAALGGMTRGMSATAAAAFEQTLGAELARGRSMAEAAAAAAQVAAAAGGGISATAQALGDLASGNLDRLMAGLSGSAATAFEKTLSGALSRGGDPATAIALARTAAREAGEREQASAANPFAGLASGAAGTDPRPAYDRALGAALMAGLPLDAAQARARDAVRAMNAATGANPAESLAGGRDPAQSLGAKANDPVFARAFSRAIAAGKDVRTAIALGDKAMAEAKARSDGTDTLPAALASGRNVDPSETPHSGRLSGAAKTLFENVMGRTLASGGSLGDAIARANAAVREFQSMEARGSEKGAAPAESPPPDSVRLRRMP